MNQIEQQLMAVLKCFLHGQPAVLQCYTDNELKRLFELAEMHMVLPIVYEALYPQIKNTNVKPQMTDALKHRMVRSVMQQAVRTQRFLNLYRIINEQEIRVLVVKGLICRNLYSAPDHRASSDEDLYAREEDIQALHNLFLQNGLMLVDKKLLPESPVLTYQDPWSGLRIELHRQLFPAEAAAYGNLNEAFIDVFESSIRVEIAEVPIWTMDYSKHMLYLLMHGFKHFIHAGLGIRQVCDVTLFAQKYGDEIDWQFVFKQLKSFRADIYTVNLFQIGQRYFGLQLSPLLEVLDSYREDLDCEDLLHDLLSGGVYGAVDMDRQHSSSITLTAVEASRKGQKGRGSLLKTVFPPRKGLEKRYPVLHRYPFLLPVIWGRRMISYCAELRNRGKAGGAAESIRIGNRRVQLLKKYKIID